MYKVFIDHKPIIFVHKDDLSTVNLQCPSKNVENLVDLKPIMKGIDIDNPLYLTSKKPKEEFERLFKDFKYIEAAGGIVQRKKSYLVIERKGLWDIPKGKIDKGETPEEACVREIMEECGINGHAITSHLTNTYHTMKWNGSKALKKTYWYMLKYDGTKDTFPEAKEDITKAVWMKRDEMLSIRSRTFGSINDVLDAFCEL